MKKLGNILRPSGDKVIWALCIILSAISLVVVYSSIGYTAITAMHTSPTMAFAKHVMFVALAYIVAIATSKIGYQIVSRLGTLLYIGAVALIFFTMLSGSRWIPLPLIGRIQPSEIAKIVVLIFTARTLALYHDGNRGPGTRCTQPIAVLSLQILPREVQGDADGDGRVTASDGDLVYAYHNGECTLTSAQLARADMNGDGKVNALDAAMIYAKANAAAQ